MAGPGGDAGALTALSDEELMADVAGGNRAAFTVLTKRHLKRSLALARRISGSPQDAEEIVQDAFLGIWRNADRWRGGTASFSTWLYRIVMNRSLDYRRRRTFAPLEDAGMVPAADPDGFARTADRQLAEHVDAAIASLPDRQKAAIELCYYQEMNCAEAAAVLQVSVSAMESLLVRGRRVLRAKLQPVLALNEEERS